MVSRCDENLNLALSLAEQLMALADAGDEAREDIGCGVLYGTVRDCAYKIRALALTEIEKHNHAPRLL
jgi:hypothetical protein